ncbi:MAG: hypothetical protein PHQ34_15245, partial [Methanothrix sp.]|nr:hypothetical protein [Methanothrix sp.]
ALKPIGGNEIGKFYYTVYLDLWIDEITASEEPALNNNDDIKICTSVRHRIQWRVKAKEWRFPDVPIIGTQADHHYVILAKIKRSTNGITDNDITDLRSTWRSLEGTEQRFKSIINELLRGNIPSEPAISLTPDQIELINIKEDSLHNVYLFYNNGTITYFRTNVNDKWQEAAPMDEQMKIDETITFADNSGILWLFKTSDSSLKCFKFVSGISDKGNILKQGIGLSAPSFFCDSIGNTLAFWQEKLGGKFVLSSKAFILKSRKWGNLLDRIDLPSPIKNDERLQVLIDHRDRIYLFWIASDNSIYRTRSIGFKPLETPEKIQPLSMGIRSKLQAAIGKDGKICIFWLERSSHSIGYKSIFGTIWDPANNKSEEPDKVDEISELADTPKIALESKGRVWLFWKVTPSSSILYKNSDDWSKGPFVLIEYSTGCYSIFIDAQDVLWVLFQKEASKNIWCKRFINGEWMSEMRLLGDETAKIRIDMLNGQHGDNWLFWQDQNIVNSSDKSENIWCKKCYGAL